jgi:hypothetical protein
MAKDATYKAEREIKTYADLASGANGLLYKAKQETEGSYYTTMGALLLTAFTFEAYLNHLGEKKIKFWKEIESIKVMRKYMVLCTELDVIPDFSKRPHQTLKSLFDFRNAIAHGKSQIMEETKEINSKEVDEIINSQHYLRDFGLKAQWEEYCTLANAERAQEDISEVITELHKKAGYSDDPFTLGRASRSISVKSPNKPA